METETIENESNQKNKRLPIQDHFIGWQCRVRQYAMRNGEGRPSPGMRPDVILEDGKEVASSVTLLLVPELLQDSIRQFRYMAMKTNDPLERYKKAIQLLSSNFYQNVESFGGLMTGLFSRNSMTVNSLLKNQRCILEFNFQQQKFRVIADIKFMSKNNLEYEFTYWHNFLFNPYLSPDVSVIGFEPVWSETIADPSLS
ncbi:MAG: hypothetical protein EVA81_08145 [Proteobacteria bacterium]|nr:MAG: hypothetical protein EVA81_08145 [Pseudomonadota bacterium]